ncbi:MAG: TniB family NTP-binding protein [Methanophagales archaeon]|nr:TniB family NTP-binding protein [Methanophagales archaeon]
MLIKYNSKKKEEKIKEKLKSIYYKNDLPQNQTEGDRRDQVKKNVIFYHPLSFIGGNSSPNEIINRCEIIKKIIQDEEIIQKREYKEEILKEVIIGYFTEASEASTRLDKYNEIKNGWFKRAFKSYLIHLYNLAKYKNEIKNNVFKQVYNEKIKNEWFIQAFNLYQDYPDKAAFTEILNFFNFKTGPLSEEDIRLAELYYMELHKKESSGIENIIQSTGCFGICGPRGVGKSTLLNNFIKESKEKLKGSKSSKPLIVKLTVPTKYKADEFLTTLLSKICEKVKDKIKKESFLRIIITFKDLKIKILSIVIIGVVFLAVHGLPEVMNLPNIINYLKNIPITHYTVVIILILLIFVLTDIAFDKIKIYDYVSRIYEDLKFKKTVEITGGASSRFLSFTRRTTFEESPINYTEPALSAKITETIEKITEKTFSKVVIIIDDIDKLEKEEGRDVIFKSIRFLSSAKNCLALLSVREGLQDEFSNEKSEVRTLFDDIIVLKGIENKGKTKNKSLEILKQLIERRIINEKVGNSFLKNKKIIGEKDIKDNFWDDLLRESGGIPREAIRWFDRSFRRWLDSEADRTIYDEFKDIIVDINSLSSKIEKEEDVEKIGWYVRGTARASKEVGLKLVNRINIEILASKIEKEGDIEKIGSCICDIAKASKEVESKEVGLKLVNRIRIEVLASKIKKEGDIEKIGSCICDIAKASKEVGLKLANRINVDALASKIKITEDIEKIGLCVSDIAKTSEEVGLELANRINVDALASKIKITEDIEKIGLCVSDIAQVSEEVALKLVDVVSSKIEKEEDIEKIGSCIGIIAWARKEVGLNLANSINTDALLSKIEKEKDIGKIGLCVGGIAGASEEAGLKFVDAVSSKIEREENMEKVVLCVGYIANASKEVGLKFVDIISSKMEKEEDIESIGWCVRGLTDGGVGLELAKRIDVNLLVSKIEKEEDIEKIGRSINDIAVASSEKAREIVDRLNPELREELQGGGWLK